MTAPALACACRPTAVWCSAAQRLRAELHRAVDLETLSRRGVTTRPARELYAKVLGELQDHLLAPGEMPPSHAAGCCCARCRQARAVASLTRRVVRATREPAPSRRWGGASPSAPASPEVEARLTRLRERLRAEQEREAELAARDIRDAVRPLVFC